MKLIKPFLFLILLSINAIAQDIKYETSEAINVSREGWNKVLLLENGNTMFFHFENRKGIIVKLFDKDHKEIASKKHICDVLDINTLDKSTLKGIRSINNEGVLFITQMLDNRETLVRLRINGTNAGLISEDKVITSEVFQKPTKSFFAKFKKSDNYCLFSFKQKAGYTEKELSISLYDSTHKLVKDIPIVFDQKGYDNVRVESFSIDDNDGIFVAIELDKIIQYPDKHERKLLMAYKPKEAENFYFSNVGLPMSFDNFNVYERYNKFVQGLSALVSVGVNGVIGNGANREVVAYSYQSIMLANEDLSNLRYIPLDNKKITTYVQSQLDTTQRFSGNVAKVHTNKNGLTTVVYIGKTQPREFLGRFKTPGTRKNYAITQFDDNGNEIFGITLPKSQLKSFKNSYQDVFGTNSADEVSYTSIACTGNTYIFFNDLTENYGQTIASSDDSLYNKDLAHAMCYKLGRKKEIIKSYLLGEPVADEYKQLYTGSSDFIEESARYAAVYLHKKGKEEETKIAWVQLEP